MLSCNYELVIGLEVHIELSTQTKIFCGCPISFGAEPNTCCCPVCMGFPGALPVLNRQVVAYAIKAGLALNCEISQTLKMDRKNYFYPDLPKGYQISQMEEPLCKTGYLDIDVEGKQKRIGITRIHIEEDAGKLIHTDKNTRIDCNRCGVPLIEIVSEPDFRSAEEVKAYLQKLRAIMIFLGISNCKMNEGSMRCDINLSIRKKGENTLGTRTEIKNLNSISFAGKAIEAEFRRQVQELEAGKTIRQQTIRFDEKSETTYPIREKENLEDYRYFKEPDLLCMHVSEDWISELKGEIGELPDQKRARYQKQGISDSDAAVILSDVKSADYFDGLVIPQGFYRTAAALFCKEVLKRRSEGDVSILLSSEQFSDIIRLLFEDRINMDTAKRLVEEIGGTECSVTKVVKELDLEQIQSEEILSPIVDRIVSENQKAVLCYLEGKKAALMPIFGKIMKECQGRANPRVVNRLLEEKMKEFQS